MEQSDKFKKHFNDGIIDYGESLSDIFINPDLLKMIKEEDDEILLNEFIRHIKNKMADYELDGMIITKDIMLDILSDLEIHNHE